MKFKFTTPADDRPIFDVIMTRDDERTVIRDLKLDEAIGHARDIGMTLRDRDDVIVSDPDGRIHYKETSGSIYFRK